jgi:hypothetical protein
MGSEPKASLRVQALRKHLLHHPYGEKMFEYASTLDGWIHEWARYAARRDLPRDERVRALAMLSSMRRDFNTLIAEAEAYDPEPKGRRSEFGTALDNELIARGLTACNFEIFGGGTTVPQTVSVRLTAARANETVALMHQSRPEYLP